MQLTAGLEDDFFPCLCFQIPSVIKLIQYEECPFLVVGRCVHCNRAFWTQLKWGNALKENSWRNRLSAEYRLGAQPYGMNFLFLFILTISSVIIKILSGSHDFWLGLHLSDLHSSSRYSNVMNSSILGGGGEVGSHQLEPGPAGSCSLCGWAGVNGTQKDVA